MYAYMQSQQKGSRHWTFDAVHFDVVFSQADFPDYYAKPFRMLNILYAIITSEDQPIHRHLICDHP